MTTSAPPSSPRAEALRNLLGSKAGGLFSRRWMWLAGAALLLVFVVGFFALKSDDAAKAPAYETEEFSRGRLEVTVSATGNLQPTNQV